MTRRIPATACALAALGASQLAAQNPESVPVQVTSFESHYAPTDQVVAPIVIDLAAHFRAYQSPGPMLVFHLRPPQSPSLPSEVADGEIRVRLWWVDRDWDALPAEGEAATRYTNQVLDLTQPSAIRRVLEAVEDGVFDDGVASNASTDGIGLFVYTMGYSYVGDEEQLLAPNDRVYTLQTDSIPLKAGSVSLVNSETTGSYITFNVWDTEARYSNIIGQVEPGDMPLVRILSGLDDSEETGVEPIVDLWSFGATDFLSMPLWNSYEEGDDPTRFAVPEEEDFILFDTVTEDISYRSEFPLTYVEPKPPVDTDPDDDVTPTHPNENIRNLFNAELNPNGTLTLTPKREFTGNDHGTYSFTFLVALDDSSDEGETDDPDYYYRTSVSVSVHRQFEIYMGFVNVSYNDKELEDDPETTDVNEAGPNPAYYWYKLSSLGWFWTGLFGNASDPGYRWVWAARHGWIYMPVINGDPLDGPYDEDGTWWWLDEETVPGDPSSAIGWIWFSVVDGYAILPYIYSEKDAGWLYYTSWGEDTTPANRVFWSYRQKKSVTPAQIGAGL